MPQAEEVGEEAVEAVEQAAQEAGKDPSRFAVLGNSGRALTSGLLSLPDSAKLGIEVRHCLARSPPYRACLRCHHCTSTSAQPPNKRVMIYVCT